MASARNFGLKKGEEKGRKERNYEIAKAMLKKNMNLEDIIEITGLSKEEIIKCQNNI